jgi:hypothetical protein
MGLASKGIKGKGQATEASLSLTAKDNRDWGWKVPSEKAENRDWFDTCLEMRGWSAERYIDNRQGGRCRVACSLCDGLIRYFWNAVMVVL